MLDDITQAEIPNYEPENEYWKTALDLMRKGMTRREGKKWPISFPDLIERLDIPAVLRGVLSMQTTYPDGSLSGR